ncbi:MAG: hypothetical protein Q9222_005398 [Ikaeria aurantiellina]
MENGLVKKEPIEAKGRGKLWNSSSEDAEDEIVSADTFQNTVRKRTSKAEQRYLDSVDSETLDKLFQSCRQDAEGQQTKHGERDGLGRVGNRMVVFLDKFNGFMQAYSGIIEIMKAGDQEWSGGVAYSALSFFLIVAVNKQRKETLIESTLQTLQSEFSRINIIRTIYTTDAMRKYIDHAYQLGIQFCRAATLYYIRSPARRLLEAVTKPPQLDIELKKTAIIDAVTQIEKERNTLDSKVFQELQRDVKSLQEDVRKAESGVERLRSDAAASQARTEQKLLQELKSDLLLSETPEASQRLKDYRNEVRERLRNIPKVTPLKFDSLLQNPQFCEWEGSQRSCMMLLHGKTVNPRGGCSWLSPATFHLIDRYHDQMTVFHTCHEAAMEKDTQLHTVISSLIYQLVEAKASILRDERRHQELGRKIIDRGWTASNAGKAFEVLGELLAEFGSVHILVDRIDRIKGDADAFFEPWINLIKDAKGRIQIFFTASSNNFSDPQGKMTEDIIDNVQADLGSARFFALRLDQR